MSLHKESGAKCHLIKFEHVLASTEESLEGFRQKVLSLDFSFLLTNCDSDVRRIGVGGGAQGQIWDIEDKLVGCDKNSYEIE